MTATPKYIAPQQLEQAYLELGNALGYALEVLNSKLTNEFLMPWRLKGKSSREYAELREAKSIVSRLKYTDQTAAVSIEDMAWALGHIRDVYRADRQVAAVSLLETAAVILNINLAKPYPMPKELERKIRNELKMDRPASGIAAIAAA